MSIAALIEAVEAGDDAEVGSLLRVIGKADIITLDQFGWASRAYHGDLSAAMALHEALLPGWFYCLMDGVAEVRGDMEYGEQYIGKSITTARAWLLAILRAKEAGK